MAIAAVRRTSKRFTLVKICCGMLSAEGSDMGEAGQAGAASLSPRRAVGDAPTLLSPGVEGAQRDGAQRSTSGRP
jgi:hypothetical protein